jgi:PilZ domain
LGTPNIRHVSLAQQRRSQRVPLLVSGVQENRTAFSERATTSVVDAHGALLRLRERVQLEQVLRLRNIATGEELDCKVADINRGHDERAEVGVEFLEPSPRF